VSTCNALVAICILVQSISLETEEQASSLLMWSTSFLHAVLLVHISTIALLPNVSVYGATVATDVDVLHSLFDASGGPLWSCSQGQDWGFGPGADPCGDGWDGITCNSTASVCSVSACAVVEIDLKNCSMTGELPGQLGDMQSLRAVYFQKNYLSGRFPNSLYRLSNISTIDMTDNYLQGVISTDIQFATSLVTLRLDGNRFSGTLPEGIGQATNLEEFSISGSKFNGTIPNSMGNLVKMRTLAMVDCAVFGSIPPSLGAMTQLSSLYLRSNSLTGRIPTALFSVSSLQYISLARNSLSELIPSFRNLTSLRGISLSDNQLTGSISDIGHATELLILDLNSNRLGEGDNAQGLGRNIPEDLFSLTKLRYLFLGDNTFHGGISGSVGNLTLLRELDLHRNRLGGGVPQSLYGLSALRALYLDQAGLTGTISPAIGSLRRLRQLSFDDNAFTSTLPTSIGQLSVLEIFAAQKNSFSGRIDNIFSQNNLKLELIDLSQNSLTGTLHPAFFLLPALSTVSLLGNCLRGSVSEQVCQSASLQLLLLDGMHSGTACQLTTYDLFNAFPTYTAKNMEGAIPACLFGMANLSTLHLSGNGFYGAIDDSLLLPGSRLHTLTMSHNRLTGTIPKRIQQWKFKELDLQYNRFAGTLDYMDNVNQGMRLKLEHNRLSGKITDSIITIRDAEILDGNLFQCKNQQQLPESDPLREEYSCGSSAFEDTVYTAAVLSMACAAIFVIWGILIFLNRRYDDIWPAGRRLADYLSDRYSYFVRCIERISQLQHADRNSMEIGSVGGRPGAEEALRGFHPSSGGNIPNLWLFVNTLIDMTRWKLCVVLVILCVFMPIYVVLKTSYSDEYSTHFHQYWFISTALYLRGVTPAVMLFCVWFVLVLAMTLYVYGRHSSIRDNSFFRKLRGKKIKKTIKDKMVLLSNRLLLLLILMLIANLVAVFLANGVYVFTTLSEVDSSVKTLAEISLACFQLLWNATVVPMSIEWLTRKWSASFDDKIYLNIIVLIFNSVAAPCLISAVTDIECFQYAFVKSPVIQSGYSFYTCDVYDLQNPDMCLLEREITSNTEFVPPFVYNYDCTSSLLYNFIPVYMYKFIYITFIDPIVFMRVCSIESSRVPHWIRRMLPGILWPKEHHATTPQRIFKPDRILCQHLTYLSILLTFGIMCPPLSVLILVACCVSCVKWQILLGRYLLSFENLNDRSVSDLGRSIDWLSVLDIRCNFIWRGPWMVHWVVLWTSAIFFSFYFLDIASDEVGMPESLWVGMQPMLGALFIWVCWLSWRYVYPFLRDLAGRGGSVADLTINKDMFDVQNSNINILHEGCDDDAAQVEQEMVKLQLPERSLGAEA
jgi:Leucine-rich repeat (LRR) protein